MDKIWGGAYCKVKSGLLNEEIFKTKNVLKINGDEHLISNFIEFSLVQSLSCV